MKNQILLQKFISENKDWEVRLKSAPYNLSISHDKVLGRNLILFKYSQVDSSLSNPMVRECRGIILDEDSNEVICHPFDKFGNYGEHYADNIDWKNCWVQEKLDGSLCKVVKLGDQLLWSTNGVIDAGKSALTEQIGCPYKTFKELMLAALANAGFKSEDEFKSYLKDNFTYMFELTSRYNRIVIRYDEPQLHYLGARDNISNQEISFIVDDPFNGKFNKPNVYPLTSLDECINAAKALEADGEGYVVCDKNYKRVKIKSPMYCSIHHLRDESGVISYKRALDVIKNNEVEELLTYFPEYKIYFDEIQDRLNKIIYDAEMKWNEFAKQQFDSRKEQAMYIIKYAKEYSGLMFSKLDGKINSFKEGFFEQYNTDKLLRALGFKNE